jgi:hypothetical protein
MKGGSIPMLCQSPNKQLERTVIHHRGDAASASFHYALASRFQAASRGRSTARYAAFSAAWIRCAMAATGHEPPLPTGSLPASL